MRLTGFELKIEPLLRIISRMADYIIEVILTRRRSNECRPALTVRQSGQDYGAPHGGPHHSKLIQNHPIIIDTPHGIGVIRAIEAYGRLIMNEPDGQLAL